MLDDTRPAGLYVHLALDPTDRSVVIYPCRGFQLLNFVAIVPDDSIGQETVESWSAEGTQEELLKCFEDFDREIKTLLGQVQNYQSPRRLLASLTNVLLFLAPGWPKMSSSGNFAIKILCQHISKVVFASLATRLTP